MLWFNLIFGLNFLKPVYFFQTSSIIEVGCSVGWFRSAFEWLALNRKC